MTFSYSYKTSDGVRHEETITAKSKEDAFHRLRIKGIRPIKVVPKGVQLKRVFGWCVLVSVACVIGMLIGRNTSSHNGLAVDESNMDSIDCEFAKTIDTITSQYHSTVLNYEISSDVYESYKSLTAAIQLIKQAEDINCYYRKLVKSAFASLPENVVLDKAKRIQKYYGEVMDAYDLEEVRLKGSHYALTLLADNFGTWKLATTNGQAVVIFNSPDAQREYDFYATSADTDSLRWRKDFAPEQ